MWRQETSALVNVPSPSLSLMNGVTDVALHLDHTELVQLFWVHLVVHLGCQHACVCVGRSRGGGGSTKSKENQQIKVRSLHFPTTTAVHFHQWGTYMAGSRCRQTFGADNARQLSDQTESSSYSGAIKIFLKWNNLQTHQCIGILTKTCRIGRGGLCPRSISYTRRVKTK